MQRIEVKNQSENESGSAIEGGTDGRHLVNPKPNIRTDRRNLVEISRFGPIFNQEPADFVPLEGYVPIEAVPSIHSMPSHRRDSRPPEKMPENGTPPTTSCGRPTVTCGLGEHHFAEINSKNK